MPRKRSERDWGKAVPWVALAIALYGAGLSTIQCRDSRAEKARQLDVKVLWGTAAYRGGAEQRVGLHLVASNPGYQPVRVVKAGIFLTDGPPFPESSPYHVIPTSGNWQFPCHVDPDDNRVITLDGPRLAAFCEALVNGGRTGTVTLVGFYVEGSDVESRRPYRSKPLPFSIDEAIAIARAQTERQEPKAAGNGS